MMSRRSFLQALLAFPAVAALPKLVQAIETLPVVDPPTLAGTWLKLDGSLVECISLSISQREDYLEVTSEGFVVADVVRGLRHTDMTVEIAGLYLRHLDDEAIKVEASFPQGTVIASGYLRSVSHNIAVALPPSSRLEMALMQVETRW